MGVNSSNAKMRVVERERGHNIPHYSDIRRVQESGYKTKPFSENQTIFHMPPKETQEKRIREFRAPKAEPPYEEKAPIFDGLSTAARYFRYADQTNIVGSWVSVSGTLEALAIPSSNSNKIVRPVEIREGTPIRLSIAGANEFGPGGEEQVELRVDKLRKYAKFHDR